MRFMLFDGLGGAGLLQLLAGGGVGPGTQGLGQRLAGDRDRRLGFQSRSRQLRFANGSAGIGLTIRRAVALPRWLGWNLAHRCALRAIGTSLEPAALLVRVPLFVLAAHVSAPRPFISRWRTTSLALQLLLGSCTEGLLLHASWGDI
jgi:hypothetical protein